MFYGKVVKLRSIEMFTERSIFSGFFHNIFYLDRLYRLTASFLEKGKEQLDYTCEMQSCIYSYKNFVFQLFQSPTNVRF